MKCLYILSYNFNDNRLKLLTAVYDIYREFIVALYEISFKDIAYNKISCIFQG